LIISCALLPVLSLGWHGVLLALRKLKVPSLILTLLELSTRFIVLLFKVAKESWEGAESRTINLKGKEGRKVVAHLFSTLFIKTLQLTEEVHEAMLARGYADF
jgi:energy-coupling factor transporter transmembrane protein EcfT